MDERGPFIPSMNSVGPVQIYVPRLVLSFIFLFFTMTSKHSNVWSNPHLDVSTGILHQYPSNIKSAQHMNFEMMFVRLKLLGFVIERSCYSHEQFKESLTLILWVGIQSIFCAVPTNAAPALRDGVNLLPYKYSISL